MKTNATGCVISLALLAIVLAFATPTSANPSEDLQKYHKGCMKAIGNEPLCACMTNALKTHVPKKHVTHTDHGPVFSETMPDDVEHAVTTAAAACFEKANKKEE